MDYEAILLRGLIAGHAGRSTKPDTKDQFMGLSGAAGDPTGICARVSQRLDFELSIFHCERIECVIVTANY